ncbi:MAG: preprotein translocase subunit YajC [Endomicrobiia bacterium]|nr:preprotein translocase subunit YajC [Endomicrobiaceae bacterium]
MSKMLSKFMFLFMVVTLLSSNVFAEAAGAGSAFGGLMPLIIIFVFFYLFLIRPQQKQRKEHQKMLEALQKDDKIITSGGLYATVVSVKGDVVEAKIADNVKVQIVKSTITTVIVPTSEVAVTPEIIK